MVLMDGTTIAGERWSLTSVETPQGPGVSVEMSMATGRQCWGMAARSTRLTPGRVVDTAGGVNSDDLDEPTTLLLKLSRDVRAVVVHLSDGTREDLRVVDDPREGALRWAVLLYPRPLDVHRLDVYDAAGEVLQDTALL